MHTSFSAPEILPAVTVLAVAVLAALPAYSILRRTRHGRARGAIAYLLGFFTGIAATACLASTTATVIAAPSPVGTAGLVAAFIGPFIGMVHARLRTPARKARRMVSGGS